MIRQNRCDFDRGQIKRPKRQGEGLNNKEQKNIGANVPLGGSMKKKKKSIFTC